MARPLAAATVSLSALDDRGEVYLTICNRWSYIGIGWQVGIESCVLRVTGAIEMAAQPAHVRV
ncbi:MAG: hypothetical protein AB1486_11630 [Planctomycetota bacterium]